MARRVPGLTHEGVSWGRGCWKFGASWMRRVGTGEERNSDMRSVSGTGSMMGCLCGCLLATWGWGVVPRELVEASEYCVSASEVLCEKLGGCLIDGYAFEERGVVLM